MADIFLSYTEEDRATARRVAEALSAAGWDVWWDRRIPAGQAWRQVLDAELKCMRCMVVLWSRRSVASEWVCEEASEGRKRGRLFPVLIDPTQQPVGFRELQAADLSGWDGSSTFAPLQELIHDLERLIGKPDVQAPLPSAPSKDERPASRRLWSAALIGIAIVAAGLTVAVALSVRHAGVLPQASNGEVDKPRPGLTTTDSAQTASSINPRAPGTEFRSVQKPVRSASQPIARNEIDRSAEGIQRQCQRIRERLSAGELPTEELRSFLFKECKP